MQRAIRIAVLTCLVVVAVTGMVGWTQTSAPPRVRLVATGGTISNRAGGRLTAAELVGLIPDLDRYVTLPDRGRFRRFVDGGLSVIRILTVALASIKSTPRPPQGGTKP